MCPHVSPVLTHLGLSSVLPQAVLDLKQSLPRISHPCTRPAFSHRATRRRLAPAGRLHCRLEQLGLRLENQRLCAP